MANKLRQIFRLLCNMIRKGTHPQRKLILDLHLLLKRGKLASVRAIARTLSFNSNSHRNLRGLNDDDSSFYSPRDVEFSCRNTPYSYRNQNHGEMIIHEREAAAAIVSAFESLQDEENNHAAESTLASPYLIEGTGATDNGAVDERAEDFIRMFYKQLRLQMN